MPVSIIQPGLMLSASGESGSEDYRYTGKHEDPSGLYYFGARYYNPVLGRFTTRDTVFGDLSDPQSQNRYVYCQNNPQKYVDPTGNWLDTALDVAGLIYDAHEYRENPNLWTGAAVAVDVVFLVVPFIPNLTVLKHANKLDDAEDIATHFDDIGKYGDDFIDTALKWVTNKGDNIIRFSDSSLNHVLDSSGEYGKFTQFKEYLDLEDEYQALDALDEAIRYGSHRPKGNPAKGYDYYEYYYPTLYKAVRVVVDPNSQVYQTIVTFRPMKLK